ncbi:MAG TPA: 1-(5-phosphoribosyl)-5-[(5-phosphoribosylamino)methylideneamino]imidazole-4-carboxamide isomerase [Sphingomonas sp.]|uniref:1-(5-phosphoribosyl)-5-[(5- phosphoribosylamino)methylideneamino]imidazole-4- carboxamide isomerase n=1 Tax=Sphingomonas sp. TaxID=28214 RepID=UPI002C05A5A5|nr:1-(5-phosphoribosyl)-5-[(5-phosphoribosylamino)methylideneamino]imidazole-4-carboxamide isomerase [Sphingomonas sp.]HMI18197.1 1-(5-phosphoribosyl)-5-[(5-phosphoribosylamino)methylideneamino]imidazole-4-carboxamide isomerase [Sphingomonas sp.]
MSITVYPAIDLKGGKAVRLAEGDMERATIYNDDPCAQANVFAEQGAHYIHVVDLDGAFAGASVNGEVVAEIVESFPGKVQVGGGIRDRAAIDRWLERGVWRVVLGTAALKDPELVRAAARALPDRIVVAVDARDGLVTTHGWAETSDISAADLANRFADVGVAAVLFTDVGRDGMLKGCNVRATAELARSTRLPVIASGGVKGLVDIADLARHASEGIEGVICGRSLYEGRLDLRKALRLARDETL